MLKFINFNNYEQNIKCFSEKLLDFAIESPDMDIHERCCKLSQFLKNGYSSSELDLEYHNMIVFQTH